MEDILGFVVPQSDANSLFMNIRESRFQHKAGCLLDALLTGMSKHKCIFKRRCQISLTLPSVRVSLKEVFLPKVKPGVKPN